MFLNIEIALQINRTSQRLETTAATFTYQAGADNDNPRPVFAYHYQRDSRSGYPPLLSARIGCSAPLCHSERSEAERGISPYPVARAAPLAGLPSNRSSGT